MAVTEGNTLHASILPAGSNPSGICNNPTAHVIYCDLFLPSSHCLCDPNQNQARCQRLIESLLRWRCSSAISFLQFDISIIFYIFHLTFFKFLSPPWPSTGILVSADGVVSSRCCCCGCCCCCSWVSCGGGMASVGDLSSFFLVALSHRRVHPREYSIISGQ